MLRLLTCRGSSENHGIAVLSGDYAELASRVKESRFFLSPFDQKMTDRGIRSLLTAVSPPEYNRHIPSGRPFDGSRAANLRSCHYPSDLALLQSSDSLLFAACRQKQLKRS